MTGASGPRVMIEVSPGELIDRICRLEVLAQRLTTVEGRADAARELNALVLARDGVLPAMDGLDGLTEALADLHADLWSVHDDLRRHETRAEFGAGFVALARAVRNLDRRRAALRRRIDALLGARLTDPGPPT